MAEVINKAEEVVEEVVDKTEDAIDQAEDVTEDVIDEVKNIKDEVKEGVENMAKNTKKVVVVEDDKEDDGRLQFDWKQVGKYFLAGLFGAGAGVASKVAFDNHKAKKAMASADSTPSEFVDAPYEAAPEKVTYSDGDTTITEF